MKSDNEIEKEDVLLLIKKYFLSFLRPKVLILWFIIITFLFIWALNLNPWKWSDDRSVKSEGDCKAAGVRRPEWVNRNAYRRAIPKFLEIYENRPFKINGGGMKLDHSFALWYILQAISPRPKLLIESGAHKGHSTWLMKQALPGARIITISPKTPQRTFAGVTYLTDQNFTDFGKIKWDDMDINPKNAVVLLDDHQSAFRRIFLEGAASGFRRFIQDDNFGYLSGDNLNMKWLCETTRESEWTGIVLDDFGKVRIKQTWKEHLEQAKVLNEKIKYYHEFPPIASVNITSSRSYKEKFAAPPLITDKNTFIELIGSHNLAECRQYGHMCYVELK